MLSYCSMKRVLIVDDEPLIRYSLGKVLGPYDVEVRTARDCAHAMEEMSTCFYDLCFLDFHLTEDAGLEAVKKIKELSPESKLFVMSAVPLGDKTIDDIRREAHFFITKPFELPALKALVKQFVGGAAPSAGPAVPVEGLWTERRCFERRRFSKSLTYSALPAGRDPKTPVRKDLRGDVLDISDGGLGMLTTSLLDLGSTLHFHIVDDGIEYLAGVVRNVLVIDGNTCRVGVEFI